LVINGGDILPAVSIKDQRLFIENFLIEHFNKFERAKIPYLFIAGNDDPVIHDSLIENICKEYNYIEEISQKKVKVKGYEFIGMNYVLDYPFTLKDRCRKDSEDYEFPPQRGLPFVTDKDSPGRMEIEEWFNYAGKLPTIENELDNLPEPEDYSKVIYIFHMPPSNLGLDVCLDGEKVGSKSIFQFISQKQPLLTLHGHIHESPEVTGIWKVNLGDTICVQPGQGYPLIYVYIEIKENISKILRFNF